MTSKERSNNDSLVQSHLVRRVVLLYWSGSVQIFGRVVSTLSNIYGRDMQFAEKDGARRVREQTCCLIILVFGGVKGVVTLLPCLI